MLDLIDRIDQSISNYKELLLINQIDFDERGNALKNLEENERQLEQDYLTAKAERKKKNNVIKNLVSQICPVYIEFFRIIREFFIIIRMKSCIIQFFVEII